MQKRIAHITDTHIDDPTALDRGANPRRNLKLILEDIAARKIDEIVFTGDIGENGTYEWLFKKLEEYKPGFKLIPGNHDNVEEVINFYPSTKTSGNGKLYYSLEDESLKYIFMDSSAGMIDPDQMAWLAAEINTQKPIILFIHHPVLGFKTAMDRKYPLQDRDKVAELLQQCKNDVTVFCGHYHMPDKRKEGRITQYITPSVAFQVKKYAKEIEIDTKSFGYRIISIDGNVIKTTLVQNRNDYFTPENR
ncbi:MAG: metallophosphoesterase [Flavobacterium sp.]|nr:MAG: metallophosphoesterase [Flavobacterium sp.]